MMGPPPFKVTEDITLGFNIWRESIVKETLSKNYSLSDASNRMLVVTHLFNSLSDTINSQEDTRCIDIIASEKEHFHMTLTLVLKNDHELEITLTLPHDGPDNKITMTMTS